MEPTTMYETTLRQHVEKERLVPCPFCGADEPNALDWLSAHLTDHCVLVESVCKKDEAIDIFYRWQREYTCPSTRLRELLDHEVNRVVPTVGSVLARTGRRTIFVENVWWKMGGKSHEESHSGVAHFTIHNIQSLLARECPDSFPFAYLYHRFTQMYGDVVLLGILSPDSDQRGRDRFWQQCAAGARDCCERMMKQEKDHQVQSVWKDLKEYWGNIAPESVAVVDEATLAGSYARL